MSDLEIVKEFLVESYENLDRLDRDLIALEKDPTDRQILASIFRTIHTIKGTSGFLAFNKLEALTHLGENLLARLRDGEFILNPEITTALLAMVDAVRQMLASIESAGAEGERDDSGLIATLARLQQTDAGRPAARLSGGAQASAGAPSGNATGERAKARPSELRDSEPGVANERSAPESDATNPPLPAPSARLEDGERSQESPSTQPGARGQSAGDSTIRVDVCLLDQLMNLVGELVLARNQILQFTHASEEAGLLATSQRLNLITTELQEGVMKTRMQPIGNLWSKFPRTVRDIALGCGKQVRIEMEGKETELDKSILEAIKDPLIHLLRNAVDHGIETPVRRKAAGKPVEGLLSLRAFHEGGQVNIEISDDGAGLNRERVLSKAVQKGLISADQVARLNDREIMNLIFQPGFSTAEKVTNVSGRGVGMDVVKTNIEKIGGTVELQSKPGQGSTVRMKIPLTLAIIPALIVTSAGDRYAIPQVNLLELVRLEGEQARRGVEFVHGAPVYRLRGRLLPLVDLNRALHSEASSASLETEDAAIEIVVLKADDRQFGLVVDEVNDTEEIVVKPLSKHLKVIKLYAGATIMGDGRVALILDILGLAQCANVLNPTQNLTPAETEEKRDFGKDSSNRKTMLLFEHSENRRMAIDLTLVARLEEFPGDTIEFAGNQEVVQYRGQIMPLLRISDVLQGKPAPARRSGEDSLHVVVYAAQGNSVGLVVDRILDIVEESFEIQPHSRRQGLLGSAVIQKRITDIVDLPGLIEAARDRQALGAHA